MSKELFGNYGSDFFETQHSCSGISEVGHVNFFFDDRLRSSWVIPNLRKFFSDLQKAPIVAIYCVLFKPCICRLCYEFLIFPQYLKIGAFYQKFTREKICSISNFLANHHIFIIICINIFRLLENFFFLLSAFLCQCCGIVIIFTSLILLPSWHCWVRSRAF